MTKDCKELIDRLNEVLSWEMAGMIQYMHHGAMIEGPWRETYYEFFEEGSKEARKHADMVANKIVALGGVPSVEPANVQQAKKLENMLRAVLSLEENALAAWQRAHDAAQAHGQRGTMFWIEEMIAEEQFHVDHMRKLLGLTGAGADVDQDRDEDSQAG